MSERSRAHDMVVYVHRTYHDILLDNSWIITYRFNEKQFVAPFANHNVMDHFATFHCRIRRIEYLEKIK